MNTSIKNWATDEQPRQKLILNGVSTLSNSELLAILINTGSSSANKSALDLAKEILALADNKLYQLSRLSMNDIKNNIKGIGTAKAVTICAAIELGRRRQLENIEDKKLINNSAKAIEILKPLLQDKTTEEFYVLYLNQSNKLLAVEHISSGGISATVVDTRIVFKYAVLHQASVIIIAHNHPSGNEQPSHADKVLTNNINAAAKLFNIRLADHLIVTNNLCYSFADNSIL